MRAMKSYMIFIPRLQKIIQFTLVPLAAVAVGCGLPMILLHLSGGIWSDDTGIMGTVFSLYLLYLVATVDVFFDRANFGGSFSSHASQLEYMKSSHRGLVVYQDILRGSMIVRSLYIIGSMLLFRIVYFLITPATISEAFCFWMFFTGAAYLSAQTGALFCRLIAAENVSMMAGLISMIIVTLLLTIVSVITAEDFGGGITAYLVTGLLALLVGIVLAVAMVMVGKKKKEKEYADS